MHNGRFIFSELIAHLPHKEFQKCVARYDWWFSVEEVLSIGIST